MNSQHYGCHNLPRPVAGQIVLGGPEPFPYRFSTECRYDMSSSDKKCAGCLHAEVDMKDSQKEPSEKPLNETV